MVFIYFFLCSINCILWYSLNRFGPEERNDFRIEKKTMPFLSAHCVCLTVNGSPPPLTNPIRFSARNNNFRLEKKSKTLGVNFSGLGTHDARIVCLKAKQNWASVARGQNRAIHPRLLSINQSPAQIDQNTNRTNRG